MTKSDLINEVAEQLPELPRKQVELLVNTVFGSMSDALAGGDRIEVRGFGSFHVRQRAARVGRNPKTGEEVQVAAERLNIDIYRRGARLREFSQSPLLPGRGAAYEQAEARTGYAGRG